MCNSYKLDNENLCISLEVKKDCEKMFLGLQDVDYEKSIECSSFFSKKTLKFVIINYTIIIGRNWCYSTDLC